MPPSFSLVLLLFFTSGRSETATRPSTTTLPPGLENTDVDYPETRATFVHYPTDAHGLLETELSYIHSPLVMDVVTSVTHWKSPVWALLKGLVHRFRSQNQIIYVRAHYYVANGVTEAGCRMEAMDLNNNVDTERAVDSEGCRWLCTNGGRYCAPEIPLDIPPTIPPKDLVEETLRRLCMDDVYHSSDLKHWEYLEAFATLQCHQQQDMADCSKGALAQVDNTDWSAVEDCVELSGGLDQDVMNVRLQEQLDRQQGSYSFRNVPMMHIAGSLYTGPWEVSSIFHRVCQGYQEEYSFTPVACDFCVACQDVRKCMWYFECDGTPFSIMTFKPGAFAHHVFTQTPTSPLGQTPTSTMDSKPPQTVTPSPTLGLQTTPAPQSIPSTSISSTSGTDTKETPPPTRLYITEAPVTTQTDSNSSSVPDTKETPPTTWPSTTDVFPSITPTTSNSSSSADTNEGANVPSSPLTTENYSEESVHTGGFFMGGIICGLLVGLAPAVYFSQHEKRTRSDISVALAACEKIAAPTYHDDIGLSTGKSRPTSEELQNLEDVVLEDANGSGDGQASIPSVGKLSAIV